LRNRIRAVLLVGAEGLCHGEIAHICKVHVRTIRSWLQRYREEGFEGLKDKKHLTGSHSRLSVEQKEQLGEIIKSGPESADRNPRFHFRFADIFNANTFQKFLGQLTRQYRRKIHLMLDNASYHHARILKEWLDKNKEKIELHFLPPYSPEFNAQECVWRITRRKSTHNRFFENEGQLKNTIFRRFNRFQGNPASLRKVITPFVDDGICCCG